MENNEVPVEQLMNIGPTVARRLKEIGIRTSFELRDLGAAAAYRKICERLGKAAPVCYYLYSLEGAIRNKHWDDIGSGVKKKLRREAEIESA